MCNCDVYDDYCEVNAYHEGESSVEYTVYKYTYATKAIEKIADEEAPAMICVLTHRKKAEDLSSAFCAFICYLFLSG